MYFKRSLYSFSISAILIVMACFAIALFYFSSLPYSSVKNYLDVISADGDVESFTPDRFISIVLKLKFVATALLLISGTSLFFRKRLTEYSLDPFLNSFSCLKQLGRNIISAWKSEPVINKIALILIIITGTIIRLVHLMQPISYDEAFTYIYFVNRPLPIGLSDYIYPNNHIFHTLLSHLSCFIFGNDLWAIRLPAFIAGIMIIPFTYLLGRRLFNSPTALLAATCVAASNHLVEFSVMARGYSIVTLCFLLIFFLATELILNKKGVWLWLILVAVIGIYTVPVFIHPLAIVLLWLFIKARENKWQDALNKKNFFRSIISIIVLSLLLYLPPALISGIEKLVANDSLKASSFANIFQHIIPFKIELLKTWFRGLPLAIILFLGIGWIYSLFGSYKNKVWLILFCIITVSITAIIVQRTIPPIRVWQYLLPLAYILSMAGLVDLLNKLVLKYSGKIILLLCMLFLVIQTPRICSLKPAHWGEICENEQLTLFLKNYLNPNGQVKVDMPTDYPLEYYFRKYGLDVGYIRLQKSEPGPIIFVVNKASHQRIEDVAKPYAVDQLKLIKKLEYSELYEFSP
jgi:hypothetical protein